MKITLSLALTVLVLGAVPTFAQEPGGPLHTPSHAAVVREGVVLTQASRPFAAGQTQPKRSSWRTRHPIAFGAVVGAAIGAATGSAFLMAGCHSSEGVCSPVGAMAWTGMFAGMGAGGGAAVGAVAGR